MVFRAIILFRGMLSLGENNINIPLMIELLNSSTYRLFEVVVHNPFLNPIANVSWVFDYGDLSNTTNDYSLNLSISESLRIYAEHNYSSSGSYPVNFSVTGGNYSNSKVIIVQT